MARKKKTIKLAQPAPLLDHRILEALAIHQVGKLEEAEGKYRSILQSHPEQPDALHYLGVLSQQKGDTVTAESLIRRAIGHHPLPVMWSNLAAVLSSQGRRSEAIECHRKAWSQAPGNLEFGFKLAVEYLIGRQWSEAKDVLETLIAGKTDWPEVLLNLANCHKNLGNQEQAENLYLRTLELTSDLPELHSNLGALYAETDRGEIALRHHQMAVQLAPEKPLFHYNLGNGYWALGRWGEAATAYRNALKLNPQLIQAIMNLGTALLISGDLEGALQQFKEAERIDPTQGQIYTSMGYLSRELRRYDEAVAYFMKAIALQADNIGAWSGLANAYLQMGQLKEGRHAALKALEYEPSNGIALVELSKIEERHNRLDRAEAALLKALEAPVKMGLFAAAADQRLEAHFRLAELQVNQGRSAEASEIYSAGVDAVLKKMPDMRRYPSEGEGKRIVLLRPVGRSGSLFLHSLIDRHPEVSTTPSILLKGYFGKTQWDGLRPIFSESDWRETLVERFVTIYAPLLDAANPQPVPGNPMGSSTHTGKATGLTSLGPQRDQVLRVDAEMFKDRLHEELEGLDKISAPRFFELIHAAWDYCLGWPEDKPVIFFHIHNPDPMELAQTIAGFADVRLLSIVREPLQSVESWLKDCLGEKTTADAVLYGYSEAVGRVNETLKAACNIAHSLYPSSAVRLEDIKRQPEKTLPMLATWMGVNDDPCLRHPTFAGLEYDAPASTPVKGFETTNLERKPGTLFSEHDQRVMNLLLYPIAVQYGYREADPAWLASEIAWYRPLLAEPLDFEKRIFDKLKAMAYQKDASGPRRHFESIAQRCINLLEQLGTYPAMAPWLKVD